MIHFSCDRCGKSIDANEELRYVVRVEVQATMESGDALETEADRDHLVELEEILERLDDEESSLISEDVYQRRRYDLCCSCYRKFIRDPMGSETTSQFDFSPN
ncbi:MAG TPA: hypothetical protein EYG57_17010 [Planctomycetes bacterium]|jgi:hypothetical protein|nr:hypothetical protein [Planctomycetaceae bacterium]HIM31233.1 hypothetical protein [Planctomycetota bacterium]